MEPTKRRDDITENHPNQTEKDRAYEKKKEATEAGIKKMAGFFQQKEKLTSKRKKRRDTGCRPQKNRPPIWGEKGKGLC